MSERCGCWVSVGGYESVCMKDEGHDGACAPRRSDCMAYASSLELDAQDIYDAVFEIDREKGWPS